MQRIRTRAQFQAAMAGDIVARTSHFVLHRLALPAAAQDACLFPLQQTWLGVVLPKRQARRAVTRNALRRQIYEVARSASARLPQAVLVVRLRKGFSREEYVSASSDVLKRAARAELQQLLGRVLLPVDAPC